MIMDGVCVGFIGKLANNSSSRFKIKIDDAVGIMGNKGIKLMNPAYRLKVMKK